MVRQELEQIYYCKIKKELEEFKSDMMQKEKEEIYGAAYQIDSIINIYELLLESGRTIAEETLEASLAFPNLLLFLYDRWMQYEDSQLEAVQDCLNEELTKIRDEYRAQKKGVRHEKVSIYLRIG